MADGLSTHDRQGQCKSRRPLCEWQYQNCVLSSVRNHTLSFLEHLTNFFSLAIKHRLVLVQDLIVNTPDHMSKNDNRKLISDSPIDEPQ